MGLLDKIYFPIYSILSWLYRDFAMDSIYNRLRHVHRRNLTFGIYPGSLKSLIIFSIILHLFWSLGLDLSFGVGTVINKFIQVNTPYKVSNYLSYTITTLVLWFIVLSTRKFLLRQIFKYQGWIHERGKPSLRTKLFVLSVKILTGFANPVTSQLYGLQGMLPSLPVPPLKDTVDRYLTSMRPLVDDTEYSRLKSQADDFLNGIGTKLQWCLVLKSWLSHNYVSDWWEEFVYLMGRSSLLTNSNYYSVDLIDQPEGHQATRAALLIYETLVYRQSIEDNTMDPVIGQGVVPLCSWQYERFFNTCRIPGETTDKIEHVLHDTNEHIVVYCHGKYFKVPTRHPSNALGVRGRLLSLAEWQQQFLDIIKVARESKDGTAGEEKLAALTAWDRVSWARARQKFFASGVNRESLDLIEKAAFMVILDDEEYSTYVGEPDSMNLDKLSRSLLHGNGYNRWLDKSFNFIIGRKGRVGLNVEHTWADAALLSHLWECIFSKSLQFANYDENRMINLPIEKEPPPATRLKWHFSSECLESIKTATQFAQCLIDDTDHKVLTFRHFGKNRMKHCKTSPDAFIQMALQLAYYRKVGKFHLTYEPSMTRLYKQGRTETVRACTIESCEWVRSVDSDLPKQEKIRLFQKACERHQLNYQASLCGKGFDRHLFGLLVVAKYFKLESPFLHDALSEPWRLSTSPIPSCQTTIKGARDLISVGGGFGAVVPDGYGVSYIATNAGEDLIFFHVSSKKSCATTDSRSFAREIERALLDASAMFNDGVENNNSSNESDSSGSTERLKRTKKCS